MRIAGRHGSWVLTCFAALLAALTLPAPSDARPGALDRSFDRNGRIGTAADLGSSWRLAPIHLATAADGSAVVASGRQIFRYLTTGGLDTAFGLEGAVTVDQVEGLFFRFVDLAVDDRDRIVAFGTAEDRSARTRIPGYVGALVNPTFVVVLRFDAHGNLDPAFGGGDGIVRTELGLPRTFQAEDGTFPPLVRTESGLVDSAGRPIVFPSTLEFDPGGVRGRFFWADRPGVRLAEAGDPDPSYAPEEARTDVAVDASGRTAMLEGTGIRKDSIRLLSPDGSIERSFGRGGRVKIRLPGKRAKASSLAFDRRGRLLVVGSAMRRRSSTIGFDEPHELLVVGRLHKSGRLDRRFGRRGWIRTGFGRRAKIASCSHNNGLGKAGPQAAIDARGRLLVADAGHSPYLKPGGIFLTRYLLGR